MINGGVIIRICRIISVRVVGVTAESGPLVRRGNVPAEPSDIYSEPDHFIESMRDNLLRDLCSWVLASDDQDLRLQNHATFRWPTAQYLPAVVTVGTWYGTTPSSHRAMAVGEPAPVWIRSADVVRHYALRGDRYVEIGI